MGRIEIPLSDHRKIRRSVTRATAVSVATRIAAKAEGIAGDGAEYGVEADVGTDRVRVNVWPKNAEAIRAEAKSAPLLQAAMQTKP